MKYLTLLVLGVLLSCNTACADIIFATATSTSSPFVSGNPVTVNVFVRSTVAGGQVVTGIDVNLNAATTANGAGTGAAGVFSSGNTFLLNTPNFDIQPGAPGQAFAAAFQAAGTTINFATGVGNDLGQLFGTLQLDTTGVAAGNYFFTLDNLAVSDINLNPVTATGIATPFTISAVPEPTSVALLGLAGCGLFAWRRQRQVGSRS